MYMKLMAVSELLPQLMLRGVYFLLLEATITSGQFELSRFLEVHRAANVSWQRGA
jgi:hypothetical protein